MSPAPAAPAPLAPLVVFLSLLGLERAWELLLSERHARALRGRGAVEYGRGHFRWLVLVHALYPLLLAAEVLLAGARPSSLWPAWLAIYVTAHALRFAAMRALGAYWNVRILVTPGMEPVRTGPYRFMRHPNYLAVVLELLSGPLMFGAWRTALIVSALNVIALRTRIRVEEQALREAARSERLPIDDSPIRGPSRPSPTVTGASPTS